MRHINLIPNLSWYFAPAKIIKEDGFEENIQIWILNEDGKATYEFWLKEETEELFILSREYEDKTRMEVKVFKDKFRLEDYK